MKVLVTGSRFWTDKEKIRQRLKELPQGSIIIHGDNGYDDRGISISGQPDELADRGADKLAGAVAEELEFEVIRFPADWKTHKKAAGPIRNRKMLKEKPELVIAFHHRLESSRGTADCLIQALAMGIPVEVIS